MTNQTQTQTDENYDVCPKCGGTGFYCMGTLNGKPYSYTGFTCYPCNGTGKVARRFTPAAVPAAAVPVKRSAPATAAEIQLKVSTDPQWATRAIVVLFERQTEQEQIINSTTEHNGVGFNGIDAEIMSSFAKQILRGRTLSEKQLTIAFKKLPKYAKQLAGIAAERATA